MLFLREDGHAISAEAGDGADLLWTGAKIWEKALELSRSFLNVKYTLGREIKKVVNEKGSQQYTQKLYKLNLGGSFRRNTFSYFFGPLFVGPKIMV